VIVRRRGSTAWHRHYLAAGTVFETARRERSLLGSEGPGRKQHDDRPRDYKILESVAFFP